MKELFHEAGEINSYFHELKEDNERIYDGAFHVSLLSKFDPSAVPLNKITVLFNDLPGRMHIINSMADASLVVGAVNMFEPLSQGTRVIFLDEHSPFMVSAFAKEGAARYNVDVFLKMAETAVSTKGAIKVDTRGGAVSERIQVALRNTLNSPPSPILDPVYIKNQNGQSVLDGLMDNLKQHIEDLLQNIR